jgi:hypothetical protein
VNGHAHALATTAATTAVRLGNLLRKIFGALLRARDLS